MIAVLADVHGNLAALEAVLADLLRFDVDEVLCLGDVANLGPRPSATLKRIQALEPLTVMGNTDAYLLRPRTIRDVASPNDATQIFLDIERWSAEQLDDADREYVSGFAPHLTLDRDGLSVVAYHGSPRSYDDPVRATTSDETLDGWFEGFPARLYLGAHTHEQFARRYREEEDLAAAREVARHIDSAHHEFHFTVEEGIDALADVGHHLETNDVTTIRAATPMYLMARRIRAMGVKMVLSGEGADEVFGGYLYFHRAPDARALHEETVRKLDRLHMYDCLRANKAMAAWGVEARVPFLDREFLDVAMRIPPALKLSRDGRMEKHLLREAFAADLPHSVAWRQKEQFSDGVGYGWIDSVRAFAAREVSARALADAATRFPYNTPTTAEAYLYRTLFAERFPHDACARCVPGGASVACSTPEALAWDASLSAVIDPSGRAVRGVHAEAYAAQ